MQKECLYNKLPVIPGNQRYLERFHIYRLLEEAVQNPVVMVVAGAGFGKTQAVYSFLQKYKAVSIWLQLSEWDNLESKFWEHFVQAVAFISKETAAELGAIGFPKTPGQFDRYVALPYEMLFDKEKYVLVYDNAQLLHDASVLHFMERSIHTVFSNSTSIVISRNKPAIYIEDLISKGFLSKITGAQLCFSRQEMVDYFHIQDIRLSDEAAAAIYHDTEGWAFAIHLAGLSFKKGAATVKYALSSMRTHIFKLIEYEVFPGISPHLQKYLITLSLLEYWPKELLAALANPESLIEEMADLDSFIQYDAYLNTFSIHQLFLQFLVTRQQIVTQAERQEVYNKAAAWYRDHRLSMDAASYYEKAGNYQGLIEVICQFFHALPKDMAAFFLEFFDRMPKQIFEAIPAAYILYARILINAGKFEQAITYIQDTIAKFESLPPSPRNNSVLCGSYLNLGYLGMFTCISTKKYDFPYYFEKGKQYYLASDQRTIKLVTNVSLPSYLCLVGGPEKGELEQFIEAAVQSVPFVAATMNGCMYGYDVLAKAEYAFFKGDIKTGERFALKALYNAREKGQYEIETRALFFLLRIKVALGDIAQIKQIHAQLEAQLENAEYLNRYTHHNIVLGWFYTQIGQPDKCASRLQNDGEQMDVYSCMYDLKTLIQARYRFVEKQYPAVLALLESWNKWDDPRAFLFSKLEMKVLETACLYKMHDRKGAVRALTAAYHIAEPNALDMPFIEMGKVMRAIVSVTMKEAVSIPKEWLEKILRKSAAYQKKAFAITEQYQEGNFQQQMRSIPLSPREIEIVTALSQGLTREEIALTLTLSINTVKSNIKSIYIKLGAVNHADAVRIAAALGIVRNK